MHGSDMDTIKLPSSCRKNAKSCLYIGIALAIISVGILYIPNIAVSFIAAFGIILAYLGIRIGLSKSGQPQFGLVLCHDHLQFHHRYGGWALPWRQIDRFGIPCVGRGFERLELNYIGIRLNDEQFLLDTLSPRLCAHLLTEQRSALYAALRQECPSGTCPSDHLLEDDYYHTHSGKIYHGLKAMFANRMANMRQMTGYDLLIDQSVLEQSPEQFLRLARDFRNQGMAHSITSSNDSACKS